MVGSAYNHGIQILAFKQFTVIAIKVRFDTGPFFQFRGTIFKDLTIDIAQSDTTDLGPEKSVVQVSPSHIAAADERHIDTVIRPHRTGEQVVRQNRIKRTGGDQGTCPLQEFQSIHDTKTVINYWESVISGILQGICE